MYLWFKLLHVFFIISWFAGLFYLPRIYVNLAQVEPGTRSEYQRLLGMAEHECSVKKGAIWWLRSRGRDGQLQTVVVTVQTAELL